jgi:hypothetical protein
MALEGLAGEVHAAQRCNSAWQGCTAIAAEKLENNTNPTNQKRVGVSAGGAGS